MEICFNGRFYPQDTALLTAGNRGFRYGDGVFETGRVYKNIFLLSERHFERLFNSLQILQIETGADFTKENVHNRILELCHRNHTAACARIRLAVYRTEENKPGYLIEAAGLTEQTNEWQAEGLSITLYPHARKSSDAFSNIKSANFLPYLMAERHATENGVDDAVVLNAQHCLCDSSKANIFLVKNGGISTPALHQGCVDGIMRRVVIEQITKLGYPLQERAVTPQELAAADEVFLTNAVRMVRWVKCYGEVSYANRQTKKIFDAVKATIFDAFC